MEKHCINCNKAFIASGANHKFCPLCRKANDKELKKKYAQNEREINPERYLERQAKYREKHKDELRLKSSEYRKLHPERIQKTRDDTRFSGLQSIVFERDNYNCQKCGIYNNLVVHHMDFNKANNVLDNLTTLCRKCHVIVHGKWSIERRQHHSQIMKQVGAGKWMKGKSLSPETIAKISTSNIGQRRSLESIIKMKTAKKQWWANLTEERRNEISRNISIGKKINPPLIHMLH